MKKIFTIILIFSLLLTITFCNYDEYIEYEYDENGEDEDYDEWTILDDLTEEDIKILQDMFSKILPNIQNILNDFKNPKTNGEKVIYEALEKYSSVLELLYPILDSDPQTFSEALIQIVNKFDNLDEYFEEIIQITYIDELIDAYFSLLTNKKVIKMYEVLKDDIIYLFKKIMGPEDAIYSDIFADVYPNIINLIKNDDVIKFLKKITLITEYYHYSLDHFSKKYDIKALGNEIKEIYNNKIKNNKDYNKIVEKYIEKFPYLNQSFIEEFFNQYIDALVKGFYN